MLTFDKEFIQQLMKGDKTAFSRFYLDTVDYFSRYLRSRYPTLSKAMIEDILSGFYLKIWKAKYTEQQNFKAYVWTVLKNHTKDYFKKKTELSFGHMQVADDEEQFEDRLVSDDDVTELMETNFKKEKIQQAIAELPESEGEVFYLKFVEQKTNEEIQAIVNISSDAVRQRLSRAVKRLKKNLAT